MQTYTAEDIAEAKSKLPKPVLDYLNSPELAEAYSALQKTLGLNLREVSLVIEVVTLTLTGLAPESTFQNNLHETLPELSNDKRAQLISYINSHIFAEANRRLQGEKTS